MHRIRFGVLPIMLAALLAASPAAARLHAPRMVGPANGAQFQELPAITWAAVRHAAEYEYEISGDAQFHSILGSGPGNGTNRTHNLAASLSRVVPDGTYWWRVRALTGKGAAGAWSRARHIVKRWTTAPQLLGGDRTSITWPATPLVLHWSTVPYAVKYIVSVATDPALSNLVLGTPSLPQYTDGTSFVLPGTLASGAYYWAITPIDAEGHRGTRSRVGTFTWTWPTSTSTLFTNLSVDARVFDPLFSWNPIPGAARYDVEINQHPDFPPGSKWCCSAPTIGTSLAPQQDLANNSTYWWRVRAIDTAGHAGDWNYGGSFTKAFDAATPTIPNLKVVDTAGHAVSGTPPTTDTPIVTWDPVPGASRYEVTVGTWHDNFCDWGAESFYHAETATTSWTPLGFPGSFKPTSTAWPAPQVDNPVLGQGTWCVRVVARSDDDAQRGQVVSAPSYVNPTNDPNTPAFDWVSAPSPATSQPSGTGSVTSLSVAPLTMPIPAGTTFTIAGDTNSPKIAFTTTAAAPVAAATLAVSVSQSITTTIPPGKLVLSFQPFMTSRSNYIAPVTDPVTGPPLTRLPPLLTWNWIPGATSFFVVIARDAAFTDVADVAYTNVPAYSPRLGDSDPLADKDSAYYWAVIPARIDPNTHKLSFNDSVAFDNPQTFNKSSIPPSPVAPGDGANVSTWPTFWWTRVDNARNYTVQVSQDPSFGAPIDNVTTDATAYTSSSTYPADTVLYWRVRGNDWTGQGLNWSPVQTFTRRLPTSSPSPGNPTAGQLEPVLTWSGVPGAVAYSVHIEQGDGTTSDFTVDSTAFAPISHRGIGRVRWQVRPLFPTNAFSTVGGGFFPLQPYLLELGPPAGARGIKSGSRLVISWSPDPAAKTYEVDISTTDSFSNTIDSHRVDGTSWAPDINYSLPANRGRLYWRVGAVSTDALTVGSFATGSFLNGKPPKHHGKKKRHKRKHG